MDIPRSEIKEILDKADCQEPGYFFAMSSSIARRPTMPYNSAICWSRSSLAAPCSNNIGECSMNSCFQRDRSESLIPYSRLT